MKSPLIRWLLTLNVLVFCWIVGGFLVHRHQQQQQLERQRAAFDRIMSQLPKFDRIDPADYKHLYEVGHIADTDKSLSDKQMAFVASELTETYGGKISQVGQGTAEITLAGLKRWSPAQEHMAATALVSLLPATGPDRLVTDTNRSTICSLLVHLGARETVPNILPLLNDPSPETRAVAKRALQRLGYRPS